MKKLSRKFYERETLTVAKELIGKYLVHADHEGTTVGKIVETEAYCGITDKASHAYGGKITNRNKIMFGPAGYAYVYMIYGMYYCFNVVTDKDGTAGAVLVRGLEPVDGVEIMARRRAKQTKTEIKIEVKRENKIRKSLTDGPGKLCIAMDITKKLNGTDLCGDTMFITVGEKVLSKNVAALARIGIDYAGEAKHYPWRYKIEEL